MQTRVDPKTGHVMVDLQGDDFLVALDWLTDVHERFTGFDLRFLMSVRGRLERQFLAGSPSGALTQRQYDFLVVLMRKRPGNRTY